MKIQIYKASKIKKQHDLNSKMVCEFIALFINLNNREPTETEIIDNLKEKLNVETIKKLIGENKSTVIKTNMNDSMMNMV